MKIELEDTLNWILIGTGWLIYTCYFIFQFKILLLCAGICFMAGTIISFCNLMKLKRQNQSDDDEYWR